MKGEKAEKLYDLFKEYGFIETLTKFLFYMFALYVDFVLLYIMIFWFNFMA